MSEIRVANLVARTQGDKIEFEVQGNASSAKVDYRELPLLLDFFNSYILSQANRRTGFRIDLNQLAVDVSDRFQVAVIARNERIAVRPIDISITGILLESHLYLGETGEALDIELSFGANTVALAAEIVRQDERGERTALKFFELRGESRFNPPAELRAIFNAIEELWLEKSLNLEWSGSRPMPQSRASVNRREQDAGQRR